MSRIADADGTAGLKMVLAETGVSAARHNGRAVYRELFMADPSKRLRIAVLYGGRSAEHEVSLMSATNVMRALDPTKYDAVPIFVTREGEWFLCGF